MQLPTEATIQPGPAGLLCHYHDELLWNLRILNIRGRLEHEANGWVFYPLQVSPGSGDMGSPLVMLTGMVKSRRATARYLAKRGLPRPTIPWTEFAALRAESK